MGLVLHPIGMGHNSVHGHKLFSSANIFMAEYVSLKSGTLLTVLRTTSDCPGLEQMLFVSL